MSRRSADASNGDPASRAAVRRRLLAWYDRNRRDLPWRRRAGDPYAQWVAEVMLQQTRVETVIPYYERFLKRFPDLPTLAASEDEEVLKYWEGLGYYRRIWHLHRAAQRLHERGEGAPATAEALRRLPGVGDYTAAAIASIAGNEPVAAVDGNVSRVLARLFNVSRDLLQPAGKKRIRSLADALISPSRPGDFNQAWMDLGRTVCTPRSPRCEACPLRLLCAARRLGKTDALPIRGGRRPRAVPTVSLVAVIVIQGDRLLLRRRPAGGAWSGLWEFPSAETVSRKADGVAVDLLARYALEPIEKPRDLGVIKHSLTHRTLTVRVFRCGVRARGRLPHGEIVEWKPRTALAAVPLSTLHRRIAERALT